MAGGYRAVSAKGHWRAHKSATTHWPWINEHILVAERALGKRLPSSAHVHHVDENKRNNTPTNLVICENGTYHKLLHRRARIVRAGGNPNTQRICGTCGEVKDVSEFNRFRDDYQRRCRPCSSVGFRAWAAARREARG